MAIVASGQVSLADFRTEYVGGSGQISMADLYRGGSYIKANAGDNTATNLAASVPTSGEVEFADFLGTAKGWKKTYSADATNQSVAGIFGDDEDVNYPKFIDVDSGVTIGGTGGTAALTIGASLAGSLEINNSGTIVGTGGSSGGAGGNAIACSASGVTLNNTSNGILAGGGGAGGSGGAGGTGGTGGNGYTTSSYYSGFGYQESQRNWYYGVYSGSVIFPGIGYISMNGSQAYGSTFNNGYYTFYKGNARLTQEDNAKHEVAVAYSSTSYFSGGSGGSGGAGGAGGNGQGYSQAQSSGAAGSAGSAGAAGGTNAGAGGTGGTGGTGGAGGTYGNAGSSGATGSTGNTGANGNSTNGSAGSAGSGGTSGGAAGAATSGTSITINNSGNVYGATA